QAKPARGPGLFNTELPPDGHVLQSRQAPGQPYPLELALAAITAERIEGQALRTMGVVDDREPAVGPVHLPARRRRRETERTCQAAVILADQLGGEFADHALLPR